MHCAVGAAKRALGEKHMQRQAHLYTICLSCRSASARIFEFDQVSRESLVGSVHDVLRHRHCPEPEPSTWHVRAVVIAEPEQLREVAAPEVTRRIEVPVGHPKSLGMAQVHVAQEHVAVLFFFGPSRMKFISPCLARAETPRPTLYSAEIFSGARLADLRGQSAKYPPHPNMPFLSGNLKPPAHMLRAFERLVP